MWQVKGVTGVAGKTFHQWTLKGYPSHSIRRRCEPSGDACGREVTRGLNQTRASLRYHDPKTKSGGGCEVVFR